MVSAVARLERALANGERGYVTVTGTHGVMEAQTDKDLERIINHSLLTIPDGRSMVWVGWGQGFSEMRQVTGPDLMLQICQISPAKGYTHFLYGGNQDVAEDLARSLQARYPGLKVVGIYTPPYRPLSEQEQADLARQVEEAKPDFFWVGLSTPKQEKFMDEYWGRLNAKLMLGVGAAFDIHSGRIQDCPYWMKFLGLNWLHRLAQDPKRLWRRYFHSHPKFVALALMQQAGRLKKGREGGRG